MFDERKLYGRARIETSEDAVTEGNLLAVLGRTEAVFRKNKDEIDYLHRYYLGEQPVLNRVKAIRPEICNRPVENHAQEIVNFYTGYLFGEPCAYVRRGKNQNEGTDDVDRNIERLNDAMAYEGKASSDRILGQWMMESGVGYRIILPDKGRAGYMQDEVPFLIDVIDPRCGYVIRSSGIGRRPLACVIHTVRDDLTETLTIYTKNTCFVVENGKIVGKSPNWMGVVPMIEYELNPERMGAFEPVLSLLDQVNNMAANRYDGVEQFIQALMVFKNCDVNEITLEKVKSTGAINIKSTTGMPADVSLMTAELNQQQTQVLVDNTYDQISAISGLPSTTGSEAATSDNVGAVIVRNGWNQAEARAKQIEEMFKRSEKDFLQVALMLMRTVEELELSLRDVDIKFTRRQYENLQSKAQVFAELLGQPIDPEIAFTYSGLFSDPQSAYAASKPYLKKNADPEK